MIKRKWYPLLAAVLVFSTLSARVARAEDSDLVKAAEKLSEEMQESMKRFEPSAPTKSWTAMTAAERARFDRMAAGLAKEIQAGDGPLLRQIRKSPDGYKQLRAIHKTLCSEASTQGEALHTIDDPKEAARMIAKNRETVYRMDMLQRELFHEFSAAL